MARRRRPRGRPGSPTTADALLDQANDAARETRDFERWQARVAVARKIRGDWERRYEVEKGEQYFLGDYRAEVRMNHFGATIDTQLPNLFLSAPKFFVRPKPGGESLQADRNAAIGEGVLQAIAEQDDNLEQVGDLAILQAFFRVGALKVVYDPRLEPNPKRGETIYQRDAQGETVRDEAGAPVPLRDPLTGDVVVEPDEVITDEVYRWMWVDAATLLLPDEGPDPLRWTWIGEEIVVPLDEAKQDPRFHRERRARLVANAKSVHAHRDDTVSVRELPAATTDEEYLRYYEVYDLRAKRRLMWADGQAFTGFLSEGPVPTWMDNDPYAVLVLGRKILGPHPSPWPVPVVRDWIPVQDEYNIRRRQMTEGAKRSARKGVYRAGAFADAEEARKLLQNPDDMVFAEVTDDDVTKAVRILDAPDLNPSIYKDLPALLADWRIITGQTGARLADPDADTATEATFVERAANLRDSAAQRKVARFLAVAGRKMWQCVKETLTTGLWVRLRGLTDTEFTQYMQRVYGIPPDEVQALDRLLPGLKDGAKARVGSQQWQEITREDLTFEADVTIAPGSARPANLDVERREWLDFLSILGRAPQLALSRELLKETAKRFGDTITDRMLDELVALAQKMVEVNARQAGRDQGGDGGGPRPGATLDGMAAAGRMG